MKAEHGDNPPPPLTNESIREAVRLWRKNKAEFTAKHGPIEKWNTSQVTNMRALFDYDNKFNENISQWDVSNVTDMNCMFFGASSFNQDVSGWDVSQEKYMSQMLYEESFNQDVSGWDVSKASKLSRMDSVLAGTEVSKLLITELNVCSFFERKYLEMNCRKRRKVFVFVETTHGFSVIFG